MIMIIMIIMIVKIMTIMIIKIMIIMMMKIIAIKESILHHITAGFIGTSLKWPLKSREAKVATENPTKRWNLSK